MPDDNVIAVKPLSSLAPVSPYVFYLMHEGSGVTLEDSAGQGPDLTVQGTDPASSIWANAEWLTLGGDHFALSGADDVIDAIFRLSDIGDGALFISYDFYFDGDVTGGECAFTWGSQGGSYPDDQGYGMNMTSAEGIQFLSRGSNTTNTYNVPGSDLGSLGSTRITCTWEILGDGTVNFYVNGALLGGVSAAEFDGIQYSNLDGSPSGLTLFARSNSAGQDRFLSGAGGNARMARFFACKIPTWQAGDGLAVNRQMYYGKGELPRVLAGR